MCVLCSTLEAPRALLSRDKINQNFGAILMSILL